MSLVFLSTSEHRDSQRNAHVRESLCVITSTSCLCTQFQMLQNPQLTIWTPCALLAPSGGSLSSYGFPTCLNSAIPIIRVTVLAHRGWQASTNKGTITNSHHLSSLIANLFLLPTSMLIYYVKNLDCRITAAHDCSVSKK